MKAFILKLFRRAKEIILSLGGLLGQSARGCKCNSKVKQDQ